MKKLELHWQIAIALALAIVCGLATQYWELPLVYTFDFGGKLFLNALKMLVIPLIAAAIISGMGEIGKQSGFARLGAKTGAYYMTSSFFAILVGLVLVNVFQPGIIQGAPAAELLGLEALPESVAGKVSGKGFSDILAVFLRMIPTNVVAAAAEGQMLGLITFSILTGFFISRIHNEQQAHHLKTFFEGFYQVMIDMTNFVMRFAPLGVFFLVSKTVANTGFSSFIPILKFFFIVLAALAIHMFIVLSGVLRFAGKTSPLKHMQNMASALLTAFSTSSSASTLPKTIDCVTNKAGISKKVSSFTLPLGATVNMDGTALYECVSAMFIAQAYGLEMSFATQFTVVAVALLTSIGVAGIPSASLVAIALILTSIGLPLEGLGLILVVDRILDMCRTTVNVYSDTVAAVVIANSEGEIKAVAQSSTT